MTKVDISPKIYIGMPTATIYTIVIMPTASITLEPGFLRFLAFPLNMQCIFKGKESRDFLYLIFFFMIYLTSIAGPKIVEALQR